MEEYAFALKDELVFYINTENDFSRRNNYYYSRIE